MVADEILQKGIVGIYRLGAVEIYDYKQHPVEYSFRDLQEWVAGLTETHIFIIAKILSELVLIFFFFSERTLFIL